MPKIQINTLKSLGVPTFRLLLITILCSGGSAWALNLIVGWMIYDLTQSPLLTSLAIGLGCLPYLLLSPIAGVIADSLSKRMCILTAIMFQGIPIVTLCALVFTGQAHTWHIFAIVFIFGIGSTIFDAVIPPTIAEIIPKRHLVNAFALVELAYNFLLLSVPITVGIVLDMFGSGISLLVPITFCLGSVISAYMIRLEDPTTTNPLNKPPLIQLVEGIRYIRTEHHVITLLFLECIPMILIFPTLHGLMPVFATEVFHVGPSGLGFLFSSLGFGSVTGALIIASIGDIRKKGLALYLSLASATVLMVVFASIPTMKIAMPILAVISATIAIFYSIRKPLLLTITPIEMRGRVTSAIMMPIGLFPLGSFLIGAIAELLGAPFATVVSAAISMVALITLTTAFPKSRHLT